MRINDIIKCKFIDIYQINRLKIHYIFFQKLKKVGEKMNHNKQYQNFE